ncbi:MAG: YiiX/YebB-like N1pC/P60 family cysteine hydrolase [Bacteroidota bacterium]
MRHLKLIFVLLAAVPLAILASGYLSFRYSDHCDLKVLHSVPLRDGDLVLRRGISIESFAVVMAKTNNVYSHVGLIIIQGGKPYVIHVEPGETSQKDEPVKEEPLASFLDPGRASHFAIYRSHLGREQLQKVIARADEFYHRKCRFDNAYNLTDDDFLYCTELVLKAYQKGDGRMNSLLGKLENVNILVTNRKILMPGAFTAGNLFYKICNQ